MSTVQRNPITGGAATYKPNTLWSANVGFAIATSGKAQSQDSVTYWAGVTGGSEYIIYSTRGKIGAGGVSDTPVAWTSFGSLNNSKLIELVNGLPTRTAGAQFTTLNQAMSFISSGSDYFITNQDYPFTHFVNPQLLLDPALPQSAFMGSLSMQTYNVVDNQIFPNVWQPQDDSLLSWTSNGATAYSYWKPTSNSVDAVLNGGNCDIATTYSGSNGYVVTVWFKTTDPLSTPQPLFAHGNYTTGGLVVGILNTAGSTWIFGGSSNSPFTGLSKVNTGGLLNDGQWHSISIAYDGLGNKFTPYSDGVAKTDIVTPSYSWNTPAEFYYMGHKDPGGDSIKAATNVDFGPIWMDEKGGESWITTNYQFWKGSTASSINPRYT